MAVAQEFIKVSLIAKEEVRKLIAAENNPEIGLRLGVKGGGCSGFQYIWDHAKNWPDVKWSDPIDDVLVVDPMAELYILDSVIDYVEELGGSFLSIKNPMQTSSCGCGESFSV